MVKASNLVNYQQTDMHERVLFVSSLVNWLVILFQEGLTSQVFYRGDRLESKLADPPINKLVVV
jgi:hypothetical protein